MHAAHVFVIHTYIGAPVPEVLDDEPLEQLLNLSQQGEVSSC